MNFPDHIQTLMLSALYGEMTAKEQQEWEQILAGNGAVKQEFERLQRTIGIIGKAINEENITANSEEEAFYEEQWSALQRLRQEEKKPVIISLPEAQSRARFFQMPRRYLAAATVLVLLGFGVSLYRWQMKEELALKQALTLSVSDSTTSPVNTSLSGSASTTSNEAALQNTPPNTSSNRDFGTSSAKKSASPLMQPPVQGNDAHSQHTDDITLPKDRDNAPSGMTPSGTIVPLELLQKQDKKEYSEEKSDGAKREIPAQSSPIQAETELNRAASEEHSTKTLEQKKQPTKPDVMRLYNAPAPSAPPTERFLPHNDGLRKNIVSTTRATMRLDSTQKRDSLRNNR